MTFAQRLRRLLHRPPTIADCLRAAGMSPCEPLRAPDREIRGVVNGPGLVERTKAAHAAHIARYADLDGFPVQEWGTFAENHLGHDAVEEA